MRVDSRENLREAVAAGAAFGVATEHDSVADRYCRLACLTWTADDDPDHRERGRRVLDANPGLVRWVDLPGDNPDIDRPSDLVAAMEADWADRVRRNREHNRAEREFMQQQLGGMGLGLVELGLFSEAVGDGRIRRGDLILMEAMGGGFTWGSALVRW
mgnify:CR=1 FL=1